MLKRAAHGGQLGLLASTETTAEQHGGYWYRPSQRRSCANDRLRRLTSGARLNASLSNARSTSPRRWRQHSTVKPGEDLSTRHLGTPFCRPDICRSAQVLIALGPCIPVPDPTSGRRVVRQGRRVLTGIGGRSQVRAPDCSKAASCWRTSGALENLIAVAIHRRDAGGSIVPGKRKRW